MSIQKLFADAKELKDLIQLKTGMIEIIDQDIAALKQRRQQEMETLENAKKKLDDTKTKLNDKIANEEWNDIIIDRKEIISIMKKTLSFSVSTVQKFFKKKHIPG